MSQFTVYTIPCDLKKGDLVVISSSGEMLPVNYPKNDLQQTVHSLPLRVEANSNGNGRTNRLVINRRPTYKLQIDRENIVKFVETPKKKFDIFKTLIGNTNDRLASQFLTDDLAALVKIGRISLDKENQIYQKKVGY